jgi:hypothetical protein
MWLSNSKKYAMDGFLEERASGGSVHQVVGNGSYYPRTARPAYPETQTPRLYAKDSMTPRGGNTKSHHLPKFAVDGFLGSPPDGSLRSVCYREGG